MRGKQIILLLIASMLPLDAQQTATVKGALAIFKDQFVVKTSQEVEVADEMQGKVSGTQLQLVGYSELDVPRLRSLVGKKVVVTGQLGAGFTRYHIVPLIISMESIEELK